MRVFAIGLGLLLTSCSITVPVLVVPTKGPPARGEATAALSGGSFTASDGKVTCSGSYDAIDTSMQITMPVSCSDGRRGTITATRDATGTSGEGTARLNDGSRAKFYFGEAAKLR